MTSDLPSHVRRDTVPRFIEAAKAGSREALGRLLDSYRTYLKRVARREIGRDLRGKIDPSDLVQETLIDAQRDFAQFTSASHSRLQAWLTELLNHNLLDAHRHYRQAGKRQVDREVALDSRLKAELSARADESRRKQERHADQNAPQAKLDAAIERLPEAYRTIIDLRHSKRLTFPQIGERLNKTADAARMLYYRAIETLKSLCGEGPDDSTP